MVTRLHLPRTVSTSAAQTQGFQFGSIATAVDRSFRTRFEASTLSRVTEALNAAGNLFGGLFGQAADLGERCPLSQLGKKAHDDAFTAAAGRLRPDLPHPVPRCSGWVCRKSCWNTRRSLCGHCSPDPGRGDGRRAVLPAPSRRSGPIQKWPREDGGCSRKAAGAKADTTPIAACRWPKTEILSRVRWGAQAEDDVSSMRRGRSSRNKILR